MMPFGVKSSALKIAERILGENPETKPSSLWDTVAGAPA